VKAVALVDSDLRSITPDWMSVLLSPVLAGTGLVTPFYNRRKYDGTITDFLCYPVTTCLYGKDIRQPIGGDFGLSIELVNVLLSSPMWSKPEIRRFGVDIFETHTALAKGFDVKQGFLGTKDHDQKDPAKHLPDMFRQVIKSMFNCIKAYDNVWKPIKGISRVELVGKEKQVDFQNPVNIDLENMIFTYETEFAKYSSLYTVILSEEILRIFEKNQKRV
jgi:hypothetical protein